MFMMSFALRDGRIQEEKDSWGPKAKAGKL